MSLEMREIRGGEGSKKYPSLLLLARKTATILEEALFHTLDSGYIATNSETGLIEVGRLKNNGTTETEIFTRMTLRQGALLAAVGLMGVAAFLTPTV